MNGLKRILPTVHLPLYKDTGKKSKYLNIKSNILERTIYDITSQILPP